MKSNAVFAPASGDTPANIDLTISGKPEEISEISRSLGVAIDTLIFARGEGLVSEIQSLLDLREAVLLAVAKATIETLGEQP